MRVMNLPELPARPNSVEECIGLYVNRLSAEDASWPQSSLALTAYMAWPNNESRRNSFIASYLASRMRSSGEGADVATLSKAPELQDAIAFSNFGGLAAVAKPALDHLTDEIGQMQSRWLIVADIFHKIVDTRMTIAFRLTGAQASQRRSNYAKSNAAC